MSSVSNENFYLHLVWLLTIFLFCMKININCLNSKDSNSKFPKFSTSIIKLVGLLQ